MNDYNVEVSPEQASCDARSGVSELQASSESGPSEVADTAPKPTVPVDLFPWDASQQAVLDDRGVTIRAEVKGLDARWFSLQMASGNWTAVRRERGRS